MARVSGREARTGPGASVRWTNGVVPCHATWDILLRESLGSRDCSNRVGWVEFTFFYLLQESLGTVVIG
jgi:hypothetical protein